MEQKECQGKLDAFLLLHSEVIDCFGIIVLQLAEGRKLLAMGCKSYRLIKIMSLYSSIAG